MKVERRFSAVQIVYILDQVRALEREMLKRMQEAGLTDIKPQILVVTRLIPEAQGTTCDQRLEDINGTRHARILRVPFKDKSGKVVPQWMSRCCCSLMTLKFWTIWAIRGVPVCEEVVTMSLTAKMSSRYCAALASTPLLLGCQFKLGLCPGSASSSSQGLV